MNIRNKIEEISVEAGRKINFLLVQCRRDGYNFIKVTRINDGDV